MSKTAKPKQGVINAVNAVRAEASTAYQDGVPEVGIGSMISEIANPILNYEIFANEFISGLINRIALTKISNLVYNNPLARFKKGSIPLGTDVQDIYTNPAIAQDYSSDEVAMGKLLSKDEPDTKVVYYRRNRKDLYPVTIERDQLEGAFVSWETLEDLVSSITNSLYSGNYIDEFEYTKNLVNDAIELQKVIFQKTDNVKDAETAKKFVKTCRNLFSKFSFPSTKYNAYSLLNQDETATPVKTWTNEDRICLIVKADVMSEVDVEVLAKAFNLDSSKLMGSIFQIDEFRDPNVQAVLCDEAFLQIYDNKLKFTEFYNPRTLTNNFYLHAWGTFSISPFANAVVLTAKLPNE